MFFQESYNLGFRLVKANRKGFQDDGDSKVGRKNQRLWLVGLSPGG